LAFRHAIEDVEEGLLGRLRQRLDRFSIDGDVREDPRAGNVVIPNPVVNQLVMPLPLAGLQIDCDDALAEQVITYPVAAVIVAVGSLTGRYAKPSSSSTDIWARTPVLPV
jgi:hypothetical protein